MTAQIQARKGLLFYVPPGTGKTHTIHYQASQLPNHTTLLVTAEQVGMIGEYFRLARFLQPSLTVIEDVDLIARESSILIKPSQHVVCRVLLTRDHTPLPVTVQSTDAPRHHDCLP